MSDAIHTAIVHTFTVGDVEDPDIYASQHLVEWENSIQGKWIAEHAVETPMWKRYVDPQNWGYTFSIVAKLREPDFLVWKLSQ